MLFTARTIIQKPGQVSTGWLMNFAEEELRSRFIRNQKILLSCPEGELIERFSDLSTVSGLPDLVLSVGGDGTFLETVLKVKDLGIPIAGVNTGRMGFLANISEEEISQFNRYVMPG